MFEPHLDASELGAMNKLKGDSMIEVCLCITPLCVHDFKRIYSPADKAWPIEDTAEDGNWRLRQQEVVYLIDDFMVKRFLNLFNRREVEQENKRAFGDAVVLAGFGIDNPAAAQPNS